MPALLRAHHPETWRSVCSCVSDEGSPERPSQPPFCLTRGHPEISLIDYPGSWLLSQPTLGPVRPAVGYGKDSVPARPRDNARQGPGGLPSAQPPPPTPACPLLLWRGSRLVEHLGADAWCVKGPPHSDFNSGPNPAARAHSLHLLQSAPHPTAHQLPLGKESPLTAKSKPIKVYANINTGERESL